MKTLVVHASKHGATREIAERIAAVLRATGASVDVARDWELIERWSGGIAEQLDTRVPVGGIRHGR